MFIFVYHAAFPENRRDFEPNAISVTFEADEFGSQKNDADVRVSIINDNIDEADEEVFVIVVSVPGRSERGFGALASLLLIQDDDGMCLICFIY